jgi:DNA-binding NtrC family response regulator
MMLGRTDQHRMLVLDGDAAAGRALCDHLHEELGDHAEHVGSFAAAQSALLHERWSVAWIDASSGHPQALEFVRAILRSEHPPAVVVTSAYTTLEDALAALRAGACDYITKPYVDAELTLVRTRALRVSALLTESREGRGSRGIGAEHLARDTHAGTAYRMIVGEHPRIQNVLAIVQAVASTRASVLMTGESGTGKSLIARAIHDASPRRDKPFVEVSCGSISEALLESELFGHVRGAFTGAHADKVGRFQAADTGTLFLDEINSASPAMQLKLLRVLEERRFEPVGSSRAMEIDVRVIVATNQPLEPLVAQGLFRQDLYYRLNVVAIAVPSLRERREDIPALCEHFLRVHSADAGRAIVGFAAPVLRALEAYAFPGNIRELRNIIERCVVLCRGQTVQLEDLPEAVRAMPIAYAESGQKQLVRCDESAPGVATLDEAMRRFERQTLQAALDACDGNRSRAARRLGIDRTTLYKKLHSHGIMRGEIDPRAPLAA